MPVPLLDPTEPAFPSSTPDGQYHYFGLSVRAELAARAMQGLLAFDPLRDPAGVARDACRYADALILELNQ